jgi:hypothetical protein
MRARKLVLGPAAVGLVVANIVVVGVVIASVLVTRRAWELREAALAAAAQAQAIAEPAARGLPLTAVVHAPLPKLGATAMDRMLLVGIAAAVGSAFFTWLLVRRSRTLAHLDLVVRPHRALRPRVRDR